MNKQEKLNKAREIEINLKGCKESSYLAKYTEVWKKQLQEIKDVWDKIPKAIILDDNESSVTSYFEEYGKDYGEKQNKEFKEICLEVLE